MKLLPTIAFLFALFNCGFVNAQARAPQQTPPALDESAVKGLLPQGIALLKGGKPEEAISASFDRIIAFYDEKYRNSTSTVYGARSRAETVQYLNQAAKDKKGAVVIGSTWGDVLYFKAYALVELKRPGEAKEVLERALILSPKNAQYRSELGQIYSNEKAWDKSLESYRLAATAAEESSPDSAKTSELSRAWRGMGYVHVELGQLTEAQALYEKCLTLDSNDKVAAGELQYVKSLRAKQNLK